MPKIVSEKVWVKFSADELQRILQRVYEGFPEGELVDVNVHNDDHKVHEVTFGIKRFSIEENTDLKIR